MQPIAIGGTSSIYPEPRLSLDPALADQLRQGPFYRRAGEAQVLGHGTDGVPALTVLVCPVMEVQQYLLGSGTQFRVAVDLVKIAHFFSFSFPV